MANQIVKYYLQNGIAALKKGKTKEILQNIQTGIVGHYKNFNITYTNLDLKKKQFTIQVAVDKSKPKSTTIDKKVNLLYIISIFTRDWINFITAAKKCAKTKVSTDDAVTGRISPQRRG